MISGLRSLGLPAAYVSGYLRTTRNPEQTQLQGADAMHAWVMVWCGEAIGWIGFDPTNDMIASDDHIALAVGRDYSDVAPMDGVIVAAGGQRITVSVSVTPVQPTAALLKDLKQRGLLDSTLVLWCGEFGRTPMVEIRNPAEKDNGGRDHHPIAYSLWMAGGGIKGGQVVGKTDDLCMNIVEDRVHVHDLQATILKCLGLEHTRLTYHLMGRDFRLTDVAGNVVPKLLA